MNNKLVSVVILNWNGLNDTIKCLESVKNLTYKNIEIIVVDNGSRPDSKKFLSNLENIVYVDNKINRGFTGGHIDGLSVAKGNYIVLLNNDAVIASNYIEQALKSFINDKHVGAVGGRAYFWDDSHPAFSTFNRYYSYQNINPISAEAISQEYDEGIKMEVNNVSGSCVMVSRSAIEEVGYLYEPFFAYYEETDLFARMKRAGIKVIYDPQLSIWHKNGTSSSSYFQFRQLFKNRFIFAIRNFDRKYLLLFLKSYIKAGLKASLYRIKKNENQILYKGFSNAFFMIILIWPKYLFSRFKLSRDSHGCSYNEKIIVEQSGISFVANPYNVDVILKRWDEIIAIYPKSELLVVTKNIREIKINNNHKNIRYILDKNQYTTNPSNLAWLSAKYDLICLGSPPKDLSKLSYSIVQMQDNNKKIICFGNQFKNSTNVFAVIKRDALIHAGGLGLNKSSFNELLEYTSEYFGWRSVYIYESQSKSKPLLVLKDNSPAVLRAKKDKTLSKKASFWSRFLERHYRIFQIRNTVGWYFSKNASLWLKGARTKNLIFFAIKLDRRHFATELKHISNHYIQLRTYGSGLEDENAIQNLIKLYTVEDNWKNIPVFIICRDRLDSLKVLVAYLEKIGLKNITFIDNDSIYPPLVKFLNSTKYQVIYTKRNIGHTAPWCSGFIKTLCPDIFYIVTDPDVIPDIKCPDNFITYFLNLHAKYINYAKVGFGLKIHDLPDSFTLKQSVIKWENQFWKHELEKDVFEAPIDTTFALYKPKTFNYVLSPSIRTGIPYVAKHMPWYQNNSKLSEEEIFYRGRVNNEITSWNVDDVPERYKKELNK